jgi:hypothetical protein
LFGIIPFGPGEIPASDLENRIVKSAPPLLGNPRQGRGEEVEVIKDVEHYTSFDDFSKDSWKAAVDSPIYGCELSLEEYRDRLWNEVVLIGKLPMVEELDFVKSFKNLSWSYHFPYVFVTTKSLVTEKRYYHHQRRLGKFTIAMSVPNNAVSLSEWSWAPHLLVVPAGDNFFLDDGVLIYHPHVGSDGEICLGNYKYLIQNFVANMEWASTIDALIHCLMNPYLEDEAGRRIVMWPYKNGSPAKGVCYQCLNRKEHCECCPNCHKLVCICCIDCDSYPCRC